MPEFKDKHVRPSFEERWRKRFLEFSNNDDDAGIAGWSATGLEVRYRHFSQVWPGDTIGNLWLDVGCGAGTYSRFLMNKHVRVIGMDYSYPTVLKARDRGSESGAWAVADVTRLPITDSAFDGVMCFGVMQALADAEPAVHELVRAVKPGGQIWIDALNGWCLPTLWDRVKRWMRKRPKHLRHDSPRQLRHMMKVQGCDNVHLYWVPILPQRFQRHQWLLELPASRWFLSRIPFAGLVISHAFVLYGTRSR